MLDEKLTIVEKVPGSFVVRGIGEVADEHLKWSAGAIGGCTIFYQFTVNNVAEGTPDNDRVEYELVERNGVVGGVQLRTNLPDPPTPKPCVETSVVVGAKRALSASDVTIDKAKAPAEFLSYYKQFIKRACRLPFQSEKGRDAVAVRILVGKDGELKALWIDGVDQKVNENCDAVVAEGRTPVLRNPTGKDQSLEFGLRLP